jgi:hypothetical protein
MRGKPVTKEKMLHYFNKVEGVNRQFERDVIASGEYAYIGRDGDYKLYKKVPTGQILRILSFESYFIAA